MEKDGTLVVRHPCPCSCAQLLLHRVPPRIAIGGEERRGLAMSRGVALDGVGHGSEY